jgi:outer membrane receptor for ferrienterochelin and colicins
MNLKVLYIIVLGFFSSNSLGQIFVIHGTVKSNQKPIENAHIKIKGSLSGVTTNQGGDFQLETKGNVELELTVSAIGFGTALIKIKPEDFQSKPLEIELQSEVRLIPEVEIFGKTERKSADAVNTEIFTIKEINRVASPGLFESLRQINGLRPQITCNVCQAGELQINGMSGPYTLILIDGMPIVSALASVYSMTSINADIIDRIEITKGPGAAKYGSDAMGGAINIITKTAANAPKFSIRSQISSYGEWNNELSFKIQHQKFSNLVSANYYRMNTAWDINSDGFTDVTLQNRITLFDKFQIRRKNFKEASFAFRLLNEERNGGQLNWNKNFRGSDSVYGEYIHTQRAELLANYQMPWKLHTFLLFSYNFHQQNSHYGTTHLFANQHNVFVQLSAEILRTKKYNINFGLNYRQTYYDDNTVATHNEIDNKTIPQINTMPGVYIQTDWNPNYHHNIALGARLDYHPTHGFIPSPRLHYKANINNFNKLKFGYGRGFRVVNLFTEDHAALSGSRTIIIQDDLKPESSHNFSLNYLSTLVLKDAYINFDLGIFYNYFNNRIIGDFDSNPSQIIFANLEGYGTSRGISIGLDAEMPFDIEFTAGCLYNEVFTVNQGNYAQQIQAPKWSGVWSLNKKFQKIDLMISLNGNITGPMRMPVQPNDFRPEYSPTFRLLNLGITKKFLNKMEISLSGRNLLNFVPKYALMRPHDPFNKQVSDPVQNPNAFTFDTSYNYAPIQGIQVIFGIKYSF